MEEKECKNCLYFVQHYVKSLKMRFVSVKCGHCIKNKRNLIVCQNWTPRPNQIENQKDKMRDYVLSINERLSEIVQFIEAD